MLPLGYGQWQRADGAVVPALLGITLQHPPVHLLAMATNGGLSVTGARANIGRFYAEKFLAHHQLPEQAKIEIELAIPAYVGLSSGPMLGLSVAQALAWVHGLTADIPQFSPALSLQPHETLALWGYHQGGLLLTSTTAESGQPPSLLQRQEIPFSEEKDAWVFVLYLPRIGVGTSATIEAEALLAWQQAAHGASPLMWDELMDAIKQRDIRAFGQWLMRLQQTNQLALANPATLGQSEQGVLQLMADHGALAWGQLPTGLGLYGLVHGGPASRVLRKQIQDYVGYGGGMVMATIAANSGARAMLQDELGRKWLLADGSFVGYR